MKTLSSMLGALMLLTTALSPAHANFGIGWLLQALEKDSAQQQGECLLTFWSGQRSATVQIGVVGSITKTDCIAQAREQAIAKLGQVARVKGWATERDAKITNTTLQFNYVYTSRAGFKTARSYTEDIDLRSLAKRQDKAATC